MSSGRQELDIETNALIEKLRSLPDRDRQAADKGRSKFLAEARAYGAPVSAAHEQRRREWKENHMRKRRFPVPVLVIPAIGLVALVVLFFSTRMLLMRPPASPRSMNTVEVFVVGRNVPVGAVITQDDLATISLPQDKVSAVEFTADEKSQLVGKVANFPLEQGVVITSSMVGESRSMLFAAPPRAESTNPGLHLGSTKPAFPEQGLSQPTSAAAPILPGAGYGNQMVVKNGDIRLLVKDSDQALDGVTQIVADIQGYVISSRVWYQAYYETNYKYATLTMGVPADQFENALRRLRSLAIRVLDENATGQDVTDQYVDLQSHLTNLEATRDRIRSFLDQAKTVDEALHVNQQLSEVEGQIEQIKGQMNYLSNRSAFSTITISLEPELPEIMATPTPIAGLGAWDARATTQQATRTLVSSYRLIANFLIWFFVVIVPVLGPPVVLVWLVMRLLRARSSARAKGHGT